MKDLVDKPRSLKYYSEQERRKKMLYLPHIKPLTLFVNEMNDLNYEVPYFDPCDGGVESKALFLLQDPGPKAITSGFISRNNDDPSAENQFKFQIAAGLNRKDTLLWNVIPWRVESVKALDREEAIPYLIRLFTFLPKLRVIILSGGEAWKCRKNVESLTTAIILETYHTSNRGLNSQGKRGDFINSIIECYRNAAELITTRN